MKNIPDLTATAGKLFNYPLDVSGSNLEFEDTSRLFEITNDNRAIQFIPKQEDIGNYLISIRVKDALGNEDFEVFRLIVQEDSQ